MKNILLFTVIFLQFFQLFGQPFGDASDAYRIIRSNYENTSGEKSFTRFQYDHSGKMVRAFWSWNDKRRASVNYYQYDDKGLLKATYRDFTDTITSFELFINNDKGNKISEYFHRSDGVNGSADHTYDAKVLKQSNFKKHKGWLEGIATYFYDAKGRLTKGVIKKGETVTCNMDYSYDNFGNLIYEHWDFLGKWSQTFHYEYENIETHLNYYSNPFVSNSSKCRVRHEDYTFNNEVGGPSIYTYDANGLLILKKFIRTDSLVTLTNYKYDKNKKLISSTRTYPDNSKSIFTYEYDKDDNLILRTAYKNDTIEGYESYLYNKFGELEKARYKNFDRWLSGDLTFYYNCYGLLDHANFFGSDGFDAKITYFYNQEGLLTEIIWKFSFGKFQKYVFEYEPIK
ncbi:MAG: hypothetical protein KKG99_07110 [Bacteroidetes bacterium]|nr:hypothetical protein [Bacteroidota bacterium]